MGVVLNFAVYRQMPRGERRVRPSNTGEIVLFTGVRYEHWREADEPPKPKRRSKSVKRKKSLGQA